MVVVGVGGEVVKDLIEVGQTLRIIELSFSESEVSKSRASVVTVRKGRAVRNAPSLERTRQNWCWE